LCDRVRQVQASIETAAVTVGVRFLDHLIVGEATPFSFKANGLL
jgi:DNA repair protein RadC